jgi:hypothetical protein
MTETNIRELHFCAQFTESSHTYTVRSVRKMKPMTVKMGDSDTD